MAALPPPTSSLIWYSRSVWPDTNNTDGLARTGATPEESSHQLLGRFPQPPYVR